MSVLIGPQRLEVNAGNAIVRGDGEGTKSYYVEKGAPAAGATAVNILRLRKHYWGSGNIEVKIMRRYYTGHCFGHFILHGHTRASHGAYTGIETIHNTSSPTPYWTSIDYSQTGSGGDGFADLQFDISAYFGYSLEVNAVGFGHVYSSHEGGTSDMYDSMWSGNSCFVYT
jgi:hypothetical protein